jgi:4-amino-4-deoxychorismate lyase
VSLGDGLSLTRGLHYGDGVFRTLLLDGGEIVDRAGQLARLAVDCERLDLRVPAAPRLNALLRGAVARHRRGVIKLLVWRKGRARGYRPTTTDSAAMALYYPLPPYPLSYWRNGVRVARSAVVLSEQPLLAGIKHLNRLDSVLASRDWRRGIAEAIVTDGGGRPIGGTRSNLFWAYGGTLYTPELDRCGVAGRLRERIVAVGGQLGIRVRIGAFSWDELMAADEIFVTNSVIGLWPVRDLDGMLRLKVGHLTRELLAALQHPFLGHA